MADKMYQGPADHKGRSFQIQIPESIVRMGTSEDTEQQDRAHEFVEKAKQDYWNQHFAQREGPWLPEVSAPNISTDPGAARQAEMANSPAAEGFLPALQRSGEGFINAISHPLDTIRGAFPATQTYEGTPHEQAEQFSQGIRTLPGQGIIDKLGQGNVAGAAGESILPVATATALSPAARGAISGAGKGFLNAMRTPGIIQRSSGLGALGGIIGELANPGYSGMATGAGIGALTAASPEIAAGIKEGIFRDTAGRPIFPHLMGEISPLPEESTVNFGGPARPAVGAAPQPNEYPQIPGRVIVTPPPEASAGRISSPAISGPNERPLTPTEPPLKQLGVGRPAPIVTPPPSPAPVDVGSQNFWQRLQHLNPENLRMQDVSPTSGTYNNPNPPKIEIPPTTKRTPGPQEYFGPSTTQSIKRPLPNVSSPVASAGGEGAVEAPGKPVEPPATSKVTPIRPPVKAPESAKSQEITKVEPPKNDIAERALKHAGLKQEAPRDPRFEELDKAIKEGKGDEPGAAGLNEDVLKLAEHRQFITPSIIAERLGMPKDEAASLLKKMTDSGHFTNEKAGRYSLTDQGKKVLNPETEESVAGKPDVNEPTVAFTNKDKPYIKHDTLYKLAEGMGGMFKPTQIARVLAKEGYEIEASKFGKGDWGEERGTKTPLSEERTKQITMQEDMIKKFATELLKKNPGWY